MIVRPPLPSDRDFVLREVERLSDFDLPPWRGKPEIYEVERPTLARAFDVPAGAEGLLVAEEDGRPVGFAWLERATDFFTGREHGHLGILVTAKGVEGRGVGRALMAASEAWCRERDLPFLTLNVFAVNARARALYERLGFAPETIKYRKEIDR